MRWGRLWGMERGRGGVRRCDRRGLSCEYGLMIGKGEGEEDYDL